MPRLPERATFSREEIAEAFDVPPELVADHVELEIRYVAEPHPDGDGSEPWLGELVDVEVVEVGPAYTHTISTEGDYRVTPATVDELSAAVDELGAFLIREAIARLGRTWARERRSFELFEAGPTTRPLGSARFGPTIAPELGILDDDELVPVKLEECWGCEAEIPRDDDLGLCAECREELRAL